MKTTPDVVRDFLKVWILRFEDSVFAGEKGPMDLVKSLSVECTKLDELSSEEQQCVTAFRHMRVDARLRMAKSVLEETNSMSDKPTETEKTWVRIGKVPSRAKPVECLYTTATRWVDQLNGNKETVRLVLHLEDGRKVQVDMTADGLQNHIVAPLADDYVRVKK